MHVAGQSPTFQYELAAQSPSFIPEAHIGLFWSRDIQHPKVFAFKEEFGLVLPPPNFTVTKYVMEYAASVTASPIIEDLIISIDFSTFLSSPRAVIHKIPAYMVKTKNIVPTSAKIPFITVLILPAKSDDNPVPLLVPTAESRVLRASPNWARVTLNGKHASRTRSSKRKNFFIIDFYL